MPIAAQKYIRKPLYVDAVRVTAANFDEIVAWCQGEVQQDEIPGEGTTKKYIKVRVHNPKNPRQTKAFIGDWLLYTERGYKVYTNKAFHASFDIVDETTGQAKEVGAPQMQAVPNTVKIPKFYIDPKSSELTERQPGSHVHPLTLDELMNIVRNEIVGGEVDAIDHAPQYPYPDGDVIVLGPGVFVDQESKVLNWEGRNYELQKAKGQSVNEAADELRAAQVTTGATPEEMAEAMLRSPKGRQKLGVEPAPGKSVSAAPAQDVDTEVKHQITEAQLHSIGPVVADPDPAQGVGAIHGVSTSGSSTAPPVQPVPSASPPAPTVEDIPEQESVVPAAAEGKRVLSLVEQREMNRDEVRELIQSGEAILVQDLAQP